MNWLRRLLGRDEPAAVRPKARDEPAVLAPGDEGYRVPPQVLKEWRSEAIVQTDDGHPVSVEVSARLQVDIEAQSRWQGLTAQERRDLTAKDQEQLRLERLAAGGEAARQQRASMVRGKGYIEWVETVKQLKRDGQYEEALSLLYELIGAAERDKHGREPAPWYTEQAAIVHRKLKQPDLERAVLERYIKAAPKGYDGRIAARLAKL